jgi:ABC-type antimicrobial peptide transport system permease subunit
MFSIHILEGDKNPLRDPYSIVLTRETADILFGTADPIGKIIKMDNAHDVKVTAITTKQPKNSSLSFDYLVPWQLQQVVYPDTKNYVANWGNNSWQAFVQLNDRVNVATVGAHIKNVVLNHFANGSPEAATKPEIAIFPMSKWRLYSDFQDGINTGGFIKYVRMFTLLGLVVLLIACINFMNLSTARSEKRAREVGVRKAIGSGRAQLIRQFLGESMLTSIFSFLLALVLVTIALPYFNKLTGKEMSLQINSPVFWLVMIAFTVLTGLLAGSYPAFYLSSFKPVRVLKGNLKSGRSGSLPRKILVVVQFASAVVLMVGTIIIFRQIQHGKDRPVGYNRNGLLSVSYSDDLNKNFDALQQDLLSSGVVTSICKSNSSPTEIWANQSGWQWKGSQPSDIMVSFPTIATEYNYTKTMGIKMIAGRDFSESFADSNAIILNQAAALRMGLKNPIGENIKWDGVNKTVVGLVPDVQIASPFYNTPPFIIVFYKNWVNNLCVRITPNMPTSSAIDRMKPIFEKYNPSYPFEYTFADDQYARKFNYEELVGNLAAAIAILSIFISCLGLFGLASFTAEQHIKEIGVRKVLGATVFNVWQLLSKDFVVLTLIACAIATPVAYYFMNNWLKQYQYKINIGFGVFVLVITASIVITLLTISFQAIKAAFSNPVKSLRTE